MARQSSHDYKQYKRNARKLVSENQFMGGMDYSDNPLRLGTSRLLVNLIQKDNGRRLRPRGGWRTLADPVKLGEDLGDMYIHHTGSIFVEDPQTLDSYLRRYALVLSSITDDEYGSLKNSKILIEEPLGPDEPDFTEAPGKLVVSELKEGATEYKIKHNPHEHLQKLHDVVVEERIPTGIFASVEGNTYLLTPEGLGRLKVYDTDGVLTHDVELVEPLKVTPMQAINYGYNMLLPDPYDFPNKSGPTFTAHGVLPYDPETNKLKMRAKVGEPVRFKLIHDFKEDEEYKVQWEAQDIYKRDGINIIQSKEDSPIYKNGEDIYLDYTSPFKQFSMIAVVYPAEDLTSSLRTSILASYHLSDDVNAAQVEQKNFDLSTAKGMCVWKNQIVYYGVKNAEMTIFISDINDPTYVPFPNSIVLMNEKVLKAFPYMDSLMVVTEHTMFQVDFGMEDGFTSKPVQANLQLREDDTLALYGVRNMVCFKSRNYYYMVVPNVKNDKGELQIAPISNGVTSILDDFGNTATSILSDMYTLRHLLDTPDDALHFALHSYQSYPSGNQLRHVYKIKVTAFEDDYYLDFHLIYDTVFRTWMIEVIQSTKSPLHVFQTTSTGYAHALGLYSRGNETWAQWLSVDEHNAVDEFNLDEGIERKFPNYQLVDTGKRDLQGTMKKRLRHVILELNNLSKEDVEFYHQVYIDDEERSDLFKYEVVHETDPLAPNYGQIYVQRTYVEPEVIYGVTKLDMWSLGNSQFPEQTLLKVHLNITGKGYYPRLRIFTRTSRLYEINNISWAYRDMNSR